MRLRVSGLLVAMMCAGCAVGPDYVTPETNLPETFLGADGQPAQGQPALEKWWNNFSDPILIQLVMQFAIIMTFKAR